MINMGEVIVRAQNLIRSFAPSQRVLVQALNGVSLDIGQGEFLAITGHSGSGKTTLLNLIGLIDVPTSGELWIAGKEVSRLNEGERTELRLRSVGFIFQFFNLIDNYTALENITFQLRLQSYGRAAAKKKALEILEYLGLSDKVNAYPQELSGGEQQRVAIGRALAKDSLLILADEPFAHLDIKNSQAVLSILNDIKAKFGKTIVLVTHELEYTKIADRVVTLAEGKIVSIESTIVSPPTVRPV